MISTGNDIVALKAINISRTKQQNFYRKIITDAEKALYNKQFSDKIPFEQFVWLLWTIKESVYKYLQRINPGLVFSPTRIVIGQIEPPNYNHMSIFESRGFNEQSVYKAIAKFGPHTLYARSIVTEDFIFSVVNHINSFEQVLWGIKPIDSSDPVHQSKAVRAFTIAMLKSLLPDAELEVGKSVHGYPILLKNGIEIPVPISLAHHDHFVAYSFQV